LPRARRNVLLRQTAAEAKIKVIARTHGLAYAKTMSLSRLASAATLAVVLAVVLALVGCASGPTVDPQITAAVSARNVNAATYTKIYNGRPLDYGDILNLVQKQVPSQIIIGYLQSTEKVYNLSYSQLAGLRSAGATPQVLNYLTESQGLYGYNPPAAMERTKKAQKSRYYNSPTDQVETPFEYNEPVIDDWYDSGYEESLYSPFSLD
jgi:hypothetical protein